MTNAAEIKTINYTIGASDAILNDGMRDEVLLGNEIAGSN